MLTLLFVVCLRLCWPYGILDHGLWNPATPPRWRCAGEIAVGLIEAQADATRYFTKMCYRSKTLSAAFGINFHLGTLTAGHRTGLRQLLLMAGDVEANPGPMDESQPSTSTQPPTSSERYACEQCGATFGEKYNLNAHMKTVHGGKTSRCTKHDCSFTTSHKYSLKRHMDGHEKEVRSKKQRVNVDMPASEAPRSTSEPLRKKKGTTALKGRLRAVQLPGNGADPLVFLNNSEKEVREEVEAELAEKTGIKMQLMLAVNFFKQGKPEVTNKFYFWSKQAAIFRGTTYKLDDQFGMLMRKVDEALREGSDWVIENISCLEIHLAKCQPLRGSTYKKLPPYLENKKAIINVKNNDNKCFLWSIIAQLVPAKSHVYRVSNYVGYEGLLNMEGIELPVAVTQLDKFERQNKLAVNVYCFDGENLFPRRISSIQKERHVHLLLHDGHYSLIKDLNRLLHDQRKDHRRKFFCPRCLIPSTTEELLAKHLELCSAKEPTRITLPEEKTLKFKNIQRQLRQPLVVYSDFECLIEKEEQMETDQRSNHRKQHHVPCGYGLLESRNCCGTPKFEEPRIYRGPKTVERFLTDVVGVAIEHQKTMDSQLEMGAVDEERQKACNCHICGDKIEKDKARDHCHLCGRYRGPAHRECNSGYRLNRDVVVVFHNLRKYDGHLIMQELGNVAKLHGYEIEVVAKAMEDYISFSLVHKREQESGGPKDHGYKIKFIDSLQFLNCSLEGLVNNMDKNQFHAMASEFAEEDLRLLLRKGVYPYEFMDSPEKFDAPLPSKEEFYSSLNDENVSDADYEHAQKVYAHFGHQNMGDYHDLYLNTDVLLLADVFEGFRRFSLDKYGLDPCHYLTTPSLAWDACLKMTKVELEMLDDVDKYLFCESGIRGGISMISHRHASANNPGVPGYDESKPHTHIMYWDANNLYGWAMVQRLPVDGFRWMDDEEGKQDWETIDTEGDKGYILEVDLEYPAELHDAHDKYPLAPESMEITGASPYCEQLKEAMGIKVPKQRKLVPSLMGRKKYILHFRNLKLYLQLGMKLVKVHRGLQFNQRAWMEPYIMFNTKMRAQATSEFDKNLLKLFNNAVFGKTMENVRKYKNIELVTSEVVFEKRVANHRYERSCRFNDNLVGVAMLRPSTCLCKPIYCGLTVLDLSKELMYRFNYEYIVPKYGPRATLLFTDTDSLCYLIETEDIYKDMSEDHDRFDFSDYPKDHPLYSVENKKVIGKMKDELSGVPAQAFCGLRPKMYALVPDKRRAKGIKKSVVKKEIGFQDYVDTLFGETFMHHSMTTIQSHQPTIQLYTKTMTKKSLCAYDDKRWLLNAVESRARGHYANIVHILCHQDI